MKIYGIVSGALISLQHTWLYQSIAFNELQSVDLARSDLVLGIETLAAIELPSDQEC